MSKKHSGSNSRPNSSPSANDRTDVNAKGGSNGKNSSGSKKGSYTPKSDSSPKGKSECNYDSINSNDISWWNNSPMYADATRVPFNRIYGDPLQHFGVSVEDVDLPHDKTIVGYNLAEAVPGIMTINFRPMMGTTVGGPNAPLNRAFTSLYGDIYSKTTGAMQFQQMDLAFFMTSFSSISMLIAHVKRALGVSTLYSGVNYYYPRALLQAMGFRPDSVIGKQDEIRMRLNNSILSFNNLKVPDFMSQYKRWYSLAHNVFADEDNMQSQLYVFRPLNVYKYHDVNGADPAYLESIELPDNATDVTVYLDHIEDMLGAWRGSSDLGLISGSIQRAFSNSSLITLDYVNSGDVIVPVADRNMLWQINNISTASLEHTSLNVTQDPVQNCIVTNAKLRVEYPGSEHEERRYDHIMYFRDLQLLNSFDGDISDEFIMEATRLMTIPGDPATFKENNSIPFVYSNTEVVDSFTIYYTLYNDISGTQGIDRVFLSSYIYLDWSDIVNPIDVNAATNAWRYLADMISHLSMFKHGPRVTFLAPGTTEQKEGHYDAFNIMSPVGDLYRYTSVDRTALYALNEAALQSVYATNVQLGIK